MLEKLRALRHSKRGVIGGLLLIFAVLVELLDWWGRVALARDLVPMLRSVDVATFILSARGRLVVLVIGVGLILWGLLTKDGSPTTPSGPAEKAVGPVAPPPVTGLRLQFGSGHALPVALDVQNIRRWYVTIHRFGMSDQGGREIAHLAQRTLFLMFDKPIGIKQFRIEPASLLPPHEVKDSSERHAIILFQGDLSGLVLHIEVIT